MEVRIWLFGLVMGIAAAVIAVEVSLIGMIPRSLL